LVEPDGATPIGDTSGLLLANVKTRRQLFIAEARNISKAMTRYLAAVPSKRRAPFTLDWAYKLHSEMFGEVWDWAGKRRTIELNLGVPAYQIDQDLKNLLDDLAAWQEHKSFSVIEQSVRLHHRAALIHPFRNGNGRWARMLANVWLKRWGYPPVKWPEQTIENESEIRKEYIAAVKNADRGDYDLLLELHERYIGTSRATKRS
jgi:Fic-DOC domain mobile mystery protein B